MSLNVEQLQFRPDDTHSLHELKKRLYLGVRMARHTLSRVVAIALPERHLPPPSELAALRTRAYATLQHHRAVNPNHDEYHTSEYYATLDLVTGLSQEPPAMSRRTFSKAMHIIKRYETAHPPPANPATTPSPLEP